jgi:hypothetical protein
LAQPVSKDFYFYKEEMARVPGLKFEIMNEEGFIDIEKPSSVSKEALLVVEIDFRNDDAFFV